MRRVSRAINSSLPIKMCQSDPSRNATNPAGELAISPTLLFFKKQAAGNFSSPTRRNSSCTNLLTASTCKIGFPQPSYFQCFAKKLGGGTLLVTPSRPFDAAANPLTNSFRICGH